MKKNELIELLFEKIELLSDRIIELELKQPINLPIIYKDFINDVTVNVTDNEIIVSRKREAF